MFAAEGFLLKR